MRDGENTLYKGRAFQKLLEISQKVARNLSKSCSKVAPKKSKAAFCYESCSKLLQTKKPKILLLSSFIWSDAKICKLYSKSKISKHFCGVTSVFK